MFYKAINDRTKMRLLDQQDSGALYQLLEGNRNHIRAWHPWVDLITTPAATERLIQTWLQQFANQRGFFAGIWHDEQLCGVVHHINVDWINRWTALAYFLDAGHQGRGIMTQACRAMVEHGFHDWKLNRITIECATENRRSRAVAERLGFTLEGVTRQVEWVQNRFVDHAVYGLLKDEYKPSRPAGKA